MKEKLLSIESKEFPGTVMNYLQDKHESIINNYRTPNGLSSEHCGLIALDIAKLLLEAGKQPYIAKVSEDIREGSFIHPKMLVPIIYEGKVSWGAHQVCCCDGKALDPMLEAPVFIEDYTKSLFGEDIEMKVLIPYEKIEEFIAN